MNHKMTMVADSAERLRLFRMVRSPRLNGSICSTPAQSGHPFELDPQGKVHLRREELQLGAAQREELQLGAAQHVVPGDDEGLRSDRGRHVPIAHERFRQS